MRLKLRQFEIPEGCGKMRNKPGRKGKKGGGGGPIIIKEETAAEGSLISERFAPDSLGELGGV